MFAQSTRVHKPRPFVRRGFRSGAILVAASPVRGLDLAAARPRPAQILQRMPLARVVSFDGVSTDRMAEMQDGERPED